MAGAYGPTQEDDMAKFVLAYTGGSMAETPEAQEAVMQKWIAWFGELGAAISDPGNPFGASTAVLADGSKGTASAGLTGYTVIEADGLDHAATLAGGCPVLGSGGSVEVYEALPM
jgi:hypothetical protein